MTTITLFPNLDYEKIAARVIGSQGISGIINCMIQYEAGEVIYSNALSNPDCIAAWRLEGEAAFSFPRGRMRMENLREPQEGQNANFVHWCPETFPDNIEICWDFWPLYEPGLSILFFAATGRDGEDILDPGLVPRNGPYQQYHHGDIHALHISYFRRKQVDEIRFHTCNLRKSYGFHMVAQGADPIPTVAQAVGPYRLRLLKAAAQVELFINDLPILQWEDDGDKYGPTLSGGKIGFRQMAPLIAEYANLSVRKLNAVE